MEVLLSGLFQFNQCLPTDRGLIGFSAKVNDHKDEACDGEKTGEEGNTERTGGKQRTKLVDEEGNGEAHGKLETNTAPEPFAIADF